MANALRGSVGLNWNVLERHDGAIIQLIYEGDLDVPVKLTGISLGQDALTGLAYDSPKPRAVNLSEEAERSTIVGAFLVILSVALALFAIALLFHALASWRVSNRQQRTATIIVSLCLGVTASAV
jgi:hypothetical protein